MDDFFTSVQSGDVATVKILLGTISSVNIKNSFNTTALMISSNNENTEIAKLLLDKGADVNMHGPDRWTALHFATNGGHTDIIRLLLKRGANVDAKSNLQGDSPEKAPHLTSLMLASQNRNRGITELLLEKGANVNERGGAWNNTPIFYALAVKDLEMMKLLIKNGANLSANLYNKKSEMVTLVHYAIYKGSNYIDILKLLLENGAPVYGLDHFGNAPLSDAAYNGNTRAAKLLLEHHANVNHQNGIHKWTALIYAASQGRSDAAKLLIDNGANVSAKALFQGNERVPTVEPHLTPLLAASMWGFTGRVPTVKVLLENGADPNTKGKHGRTAIHYATENGSLETVQLLLKHGANPNVKDDEGRTAFNIAAAKNFDKILAFLQKTKR